MFGIKIVLLQLGFWFLYCESSRFNPGKSISLSGFWLISGALYKSTGHLFYAYSPGTFIHKKLQRQIIHNYLGKFHFDD
jgi:hypothetical protein